MQSITLLFILCGFVVACAHKPSARWCPGSPQIERVECVSYNPVSEKYALYFHFKLEYEKALDAGFNLDYVREYISSYYQDSYHLVYTGGQTIEFLEQNKDVGLISLVRVFNEENSKYEYWANFSGHNFVFTFENEETNYHSHSLEVY